MYIHRHEPTNILYKSTDSHSRMYACTLTYFIIVINDKRVGITYAKRLRTRCIHNHILKNTHTCLVRSRSNSFSLSLVRSVSISSQSSNIDLTIPSHFETSSVFYVRSMRTVLKRIVQVPILLKKRQKKQQQIVCILYLWTHFFLSFSISLCPVWKVLKSRKKRKRRRRKIKCNRKCILK